MRAIGVILIIFLFGTAPIMAQTWEAEVFGGASGYVGDINPVKIYKVTDPAYGLAIRRNFDGFWSASLNAYRGRIQASDADAGNDYQRLRNLSFFSNIIEASVMVEFNFLNYLPGTERPINHHIITPYLFAGVGGVFFDPKVIYKGETFQLQPLQTEGELYTTSSIVIPFGVGVRYNIKSNWSLICKVGYRKTFTDYLDDVSGLYPAKLVNGKAIALSDRSGEVNNGINIGAAGTQRGLRGASDSYMFMGIGITYTFVPHRCFTFPKKVKPVLF